MNALPDKDSLERASKRRGIDPSLMEKDWHVTRVLAFLSCLNHPGFEIVFSGGTALSKAHRLIQRFSEDVDFRVISAVASPSRSMLSSFKKAVLAALRQEGFHIGEDSVRARDGNRFFAIDIDYDTHFEQPHSLRPHIQLEMAVQSPELPVVYLSVQSLLAQIMQAPPEVDRIACMAPVENAADKMSALAWRIPDRVRGQAYDDPRMVRHIHDLAALETIASRDVRFVELTHAALARDNDRPKNIPAFETYSAAQKFALLFDILARDKEYRAEYDLFVDGVSYARAGEVPDFHTAVEAVKRLAKIVEAA